MSCTPSPVKKKKAHFFTHTLPIFQEKKKKTF